MVFGQQVSGQIGHTNTQGGLVQRGHQHPAPPRRQPHKARCAATCGGAKLAFVDQAQIGQHGQPICHDRTTKFTFPLQFLAGGRVISANQVQKFDQRRRCRFGHSWPSLAARGGGRCCLVLRHRLSDPFFFLDKSGALSDQANTYVIKQQKM